MNSLSTVFILTFLMVAVGLNGCSSSGTPGSGGGGYEDMGNQAGIENEATFAWPQNKRGALSLSFDDARYSQIDVGLALLDECNLKVTFYVDPRNVKQRLAGWQKAVAQGHEIGNHSLVHPCTGNYSWSREKALEDYTLESMAVEIDQANAQINEMLQVTPTTFAYPCGQTWVGRGTEHRSYVTLIADRFIVGRGFNNGPPNDPLFFDPAHATCTSMDGLTFEQVKPLIDEALAQGRWLILGGHEIGDGGRQTTLTATIKAISDYARDPAHGIWIDTVDNVMHYIDNQQSK